MGLMIPVYGPVNRLLLKSDGELIVHDGDETRITPGWNKFEIKKEGGITKVVETSIAPMYPDKVAFKLKEPEGDKNYF